MAVPCAPPSSDGPVTVSSPVSLSKWICHAPAVTTTVAPPHADGTVPSVCLALSGLRSCASEALSAAATAGVCAPRVGSIGTSAAGESQPNPPSRTAEESTASAIPAMVVEVLTVHAPSAQALCRAQELATQRALIEMVGTCSTG